MTQTKKIKKTLEVIGMSNERVRSCYLVKYKNDVYNVPILHFQNGAPRPTELDCIITEENGHVRVTQDFAVIISQLYQKGGVYTFKIKSANFGYYQVVDPNGLVFRLTEYGGHRFDVGQEVQARVTSINRILVTLSYVSHNVEVSRVAFADREMLASQLGLDPTHAEALERVMTSHPAMKQARALYNDNDGAWPLHVITALDAILLGNIDNDDVDDEEALVEVFRRLCMYALEESDLLRSLPSDERTKWINSLNVIAQHAEDYRKAYDIMRQNGSEEYINRQLDHLRRSENLFHPESKFRVIIRILNADEALMARTMDSLFDIILRGDKNNWMAEPFRTAFVDMLELFISEYRHKAVKSTEIDLIQKMIRAIAIQQLLSKDDDNIDRRLNRATYYRLLAYRQHSSRKLLDMAVDALFHTYDEALEYGWDDVDNLDTLYFRTFYHDTDNHASSHISAPQVYTGNQLKLTVDNNMVSLSTIGGYPERIDTGDLISWRSFTLLSHTPAKTRLRNQNKVEQVANYWIDVNNSLAGRPTNRRRAKTAPCVGDIVHIRVTGVEESNPDVLFCEIDDDTYTGQGWLAMADIVRFFRGDNDNLQYFVDSQQNRMLFEAVVKTDADEEGDFEFSMVETIEDFLTSVIEVGDIINVNVRSFEKPRDGEPFNLGFSELGASCRVMLDHRLTPGTIARVEVTDLTTTNQFICRYIDNATVRFTPQSTFRALMQAMGETDDNNESEGYDEQEISHEYMLELIAAIDRFAAIADTKPQTYSMLNIARLLSNMVGDKTRADYYVKRMDIVRAFEEYEQNGFTNDSICRQLIESVGQDLVDGDYIVNGAMMKFRILDALGRKSNWADLVKMREQTVNAGVRNAADLAIALLLVSRFELPEVQRTLTDRLNREIGVKVKASKLKDYGLEGQTREFKTSIIYPAGSMQPSSEMQGAKIMRVVAGFLNSETPGTLYIGVNDAGASTGIDEDLVYLGRRNNISRITQDQYDLYVRRMIRTELGELANSCVTSSWEEDGGYKIYVLSIKPASQLVYFRKELIERQGSETVSIRPELIPEYERRKKQHYGA